MDRDVSRGRTPVARPEGFHQARDRRIAGLEQQVAQWRELFGLARADAHGLRRSRAFRLGHALLFPARVVRGGWRRLRSALAARPAIERSFATSGSTAGPQFSLIMPVFDPEPRWLEAALDSVAAQSHARWQLCVADDGSTRPEIAGILERFRAAHPERVRLVRLAANRGIAGATRAAAAEACGDYLAFLDHDDELTPDALEAMAEQLRQTPDAELLYSDEDKRAPDGRLVETFHKPDWSPELLDGCNYLCHLTVIRRDLFEAVGGVRDGFDGSQDYDLMLRAGERAGRVEHVPRVLYHWRLTPGSAALDPAAKGGPYRESSRKALRDAARRRGIEATVEDGKVPGTYRLRRAAGDARVAVIVPTRDRLELLRRCIESVRATVDPERYELIVVDNASRDDATRAYLDAAAREGSLRRVRHDIPFNFSELCNVGAAVTDAPLLLFLNNDVQALEPGWLEAMAEHAARPEIGAVGAKLLYPDGRVQHAGIVTGMQGIAGHLYRGLAGDSHGPFGMADMVRNVSAVTGACLMTRRDAFDEVGGFGEGLGVAFNDVDYCLSLGRAGYRIVYTPYAVLRHDESASRGADEGAREPEFDSEKVGMLQRWGNTLYADPYHHPARSLWHEGGGLAATGEARKLETFRETFILDRREPTAAAAARREMTAADPAEATDGVRADYKQTWEQLADTRERAQMHVIGSVDPADFAATAAETLATLEETVGVGPGDVCLEIGCGVGRVGAVLAPRCREWIGCDVSPRMLRHARELLGERPDVRLVELTGYDLRPIGDGSCDLVYSTVVFMHLDEWDRYGYLVEAHRVLAPGGRVYIDNVNLCSEEGWQVFEAHRAFAPDARPAHASRASTAQELTTYLKRAGFRDVQWREQGLWVQCWGRR